MDWEIHLAFINKSKTLVEMVNQFMINQAMHSTKRSSEVTKDKPATATLARGNSSFEQVGRKIPNYVVWDLDDSLVTRTGLAVALGNLYHEEIEIEKEEVTEVLAAGFAMKFPKLQLECVKIMLNNIGYATVCSYHEAATKYREDTVIVACERWLEVNLISQLSCQIQLRELPFQLLLQTIKSPRFFVYNEYSIYKCLSYWLFLLLNSSMQLFPTHSTVLAFYNGYNHNAALLDTEEGSAYEPLFSCLRMHAIVDSEHIQDIQTMNIIPQKWIVDLLAQHYQSLQCGGDMVMYKHFNESAVRQGFILDDAPQFQNEVLSMHGFHFMLKARKAADNYSYEFYIRVVTLEGITTPVHVTFMMLFPSS